MEKGVSVKVRIPTPLRKLTDGLPQVEVQATTVAELIQALESRYRGIKDRICDEQGQVRRFVNIYVNEEDIRFLKNLETEINDGDQISIVPAIAGGEPVKRIKKKFYLTYPSELVKEPIIYQLSRKFKVVTNIRGASVSEQVGLVAIEMEGEANEIERALGFLRRRNIKVEPIEKDIIE